MTKEISQDVFSIVPRGENLLQIEFNGTNLSTLVTPNPEFIISKSGIFAIDFYKNIIEVPLERSETDMKIGISHELGHLLDPKREELRTKIRKPAIPFSAVVERHSATMELESNAWECGKSIADFLRINPQDYDNTKNLSLTSYWIDSLETILMSGPPEDIQQGKSKIAIFNPFERSIISYTKSEIEAIV